MASKKAQVVKIPDCGVDTLKLVVTRTLYLLRTKKCNVQWLFSREVFRPDKEAGTNEAVMFLTFARKKLIEAAKEREHFTVNAPDRPNNGAAILVRKTAVSKPAVVLPFRRIDQRRRYGLKKAVAS